MKINGARHMLGVNFVGIFGMIPGVKRTTLIIQTHQLASIKNLYLHVVKNLNYCFKYYKDSGRIAWGTVISWVYLLIVTCNTSSYFHDLAVQQ